MHDDRLMFLRQINLDDMVVVEVDLWTFYRLLKEHWPFFDVAMYFSFVSSLVREGSTSVFAIHV